jgi:hypothetical protein
MSLPDLAAKHCADLVLLTEITVPPDVLASIGSVKAKLKRLGRVLGDLEYGKPPGRVHLVAAVPERRDRPSLLTMWVHIDPDSHVRPRPSAEARAAEDFEMALARLGEAVPWRGVR